MSTEKSTGYWAFFADPRVYRIEAAVRELESDLWRTKGKPIRPGDPVLVFKGKGDSDRRGVVALGVVEGAPRMASDSENRFWIVPPAPHACEERVPVRYVLLPNLPLWQEGPNGDAVRDLSVARASGGTVFYVQPEQWNAVVCAAGGWPAK
jgi:hypothetical protein